MPEWVWRMDRKGGKQAGESEMGWKGCFQRQIRWEVKIIMWEECCGDIWSHKHYLFCVQLSIHHLSEVKRPPEKSSMTKAALLCRECQRQSINLQTSLWSLSLPSLVFLRLLHLLLAEWHCVKMFLLSFFLYGWKKNIHDKTPPQRSVDLNMSPSIAWTAAWTLAHVLPRNDWTSDGQRLEKALPGGRWI